MSRLRSVSGHAGTLTEADAPRAEQSTRTKSFGDKAFESCRDCVVALDADGRVIHANTAAADLLGYTSEELLALHMWDIEAGLGSQQWPSRRRNIEESCFSCATTTWVTKQGVDIAVEMTVVATRLGDQSDCALLITHDVRPEREAERHMAGRLAFEHLVTEVASRFVGVPSEETDGEIWRTLERIGNFAQAGCSYVMQYGADLSTISCTHQWCADGVAATIQAAQDLPVVQFPWITDQNLRGHAVEIQDVLLMESEAENERRFFQLQGIRSFLSVPLMCVGKVMGALCFDSRQRISWPNAAISLLRIVGEVFASALQRRRTEQEFARAQRELARAQKLESLGVLAGGIAHDFNNLITGIVCHLSLVKRAVGANDQVAHDLDGIERAAVRASRLGEQLLAFAKGGKPVNRIVDVASIVVESASFATRGSAVGCNCTIDDGIWPVWADEGQLGQVIHNLVRNAEQAMLESGVIDIRVRNRISTEARGPERGAQRCVEIEVRDTGTGIPAADLPKVFDPYFTTKPSGSGLGLTSVYYIIDNHGGSVSIESDPGTGTKLRVLLPACRQAERVKERCEPTTTGRLQGRVLVVDDEEMIRDTVVRMLHALGLEAVGAADGRQAVRIYDDARGTDEAFDLVITDLTMPGGMDGREVVESIRQVDPAAVVLVSSGYSNGSIMSEYARWGFRGVLRKPYRLGDLGATVEAVLGSRVMVQRL